MLASSKLLRSYVRAIHRLSGAKSVSLFVPGSTTGLWKPILIHEGEGAPAPELASLKAAAAFDSDRNARAGHTDSNVGDLRSTSAGCRLIQVPAIHSVVATTSREGGLMGRRKLDALASTDAATSAWIGLRLFDSDANDPEDTRRDITAETNDWWSWLLALGGALALHVQVVSDLLDDPVTGLPDRAEFQAHLSQALHVAKTGRNPLSLILLNPMDFVGVNETHGREAGDAVLKAIAERLRGRLRDTDLVAKYGGAVFAIILQATSLTEAERVGQKIFDCLIKDGYLDGTLRLDFGLGIASFNPKSDSDDHPLGLMRKADQALNAAKRSGGGHVVWRPGSEMEEFEGMDRLSGIFTANMAKDYRNMVLLWDTVTVVARNADFKTLASEVAERLLFTFKPERVGLFRWAHSDQQLELVHGIEKQPSSKQPRPLPNMTLSSEQRVLLEEARSQRRPIQSSLPSGPGPDADRQSLYAVPLVVDEDCLGCLLLSGQDGELALDKSDLIFLRALGGQLAVALDRARLAEQEQRRLREELNQLRTALRQSKLVYRSPQMESVLSLVRRVSRTDATVLVTGESGTGKEMLATTIHELSPRRSKRLEVVDCATIAPTLIESELFGHESGAYTGASKRKDGRLALADGGSVLLDEIGELPLEVQGRLLRFVQEKQVTPLGSNRSRQVDVRVIAATNRDLAIEVAQGRFRQDLYYRLNVVRIVLPPLRDRPDDILFLANHFVKVYSVRYQSPASRLSAAAEELLLAYPWPGNVRELANRLMQAVILCERDELAPRDIGIGDISELDPTSNPDDNSAPSSRPQPRIAVSTGSPRRGQEQGDESTELSNGDCWERLRALLRMQVEATTTQRAPIGTYVEEEFIAQAYVTAEQVSSRAARILGIPETTFRRKKSKSRSIPLERPGNWQQVQECITSLSLAADPQIGNLLEHARSILLTELVQCCASDERKAAQLMGVSVPTYRRWLVTRLAVETR